MSKRSKPAITNHAAEQAISTLIAWLGDDPARADLLKTPKRVATRLRKLFCGYQTNLDELLRFEGIETSHCPSPSWRAQRGHSVGQSSFVPDGHAALAMTDLKPERPSKMVSNQASSIVSLNEIEFFSFCEHHMLPMVGTIDISYIPNKKLIGIGRVVRIVRAITRRLQIQERITDEIAEALQTCLKPRGVAVVVHARHHCLDSEEDGASSAIMETRRLLGEFEMDGELRKITRG